MDDKQIKNLCIFTILAGIVLLFCVSYFFRPPTVDINSISSDVIGKKIEVMGIIESIDENSGNTFLTLTGNGTIKIVFFERNSKNTHETLAKGQNISVIGRVALYRGEYEIIADEIKVLV